MDIPYTKKERELLKYIRAGYKPIRHWIPVHQRAMRQEAMKSVLAYKGPYMYGGYEVTREQYIRQHLHSKEASDDSLTEQELTRAKQWAKSQTMELRDHPVAEDTGKIMKYVFLAILVLIFLPAWPLLIIIPLIGLGMGGGSRSFWD